MDGQAAGKVSRSAPLAASGYGIVMEPAVAQLRAELMAAFAGHEDELCRAIRRIPANAAQPLQFEVDDLYFGVTLCATEETILPGEWLDLALTPDWFARVETAGADAISLIAAEMCPWFAECWHAAGGSSVYGRAYLFFHLRPHRRYDLQQRLWV
jgi:hypothetical protein